jgi:hypothetical protein
MADRAAALLGTGLFVMLLALWNWLAEVVAAPASPWASIAVLAGAGVAGLLVYVQARDQ